MLRVGVMAHSAVVCADASESAGLCCGRDCLGWPSSGAEQGVTELLLLCWSGQKGVGWNANVAVCGSVWGHTTLFVTNPLITYHIHTQDRLAACVCEGPGVTVQCSLTQPTCPQGVHVFLAPGCHGFF